MCKIEHAWVQVTEKCFYLVHDKNYNKICESGIRRHWLFCIETKVCHYVNIHHRICTNLPLILFAFCVSMRFSLIKSDIMPSKSANPCSTWMALMAARISPIPKIQQCQTILNSTSQFTLQ